MAIEINHCVKCYQPGRIQIDGLLYCRSHALGVLLEEERRVCGVGWLSDGVWVDFARCEAWRGGARVYLTKLEADFLFCLYRHGGTVRSEDIAAEVFTPRGHDEGARNYMRVTVYEIRRKIEADPLKPKILLTRRGVGYGLKIKSPNYKNG